MSRTSDTRFAQALPPPQSRAGSGTDDQKARLEVRREEARSLVLRQLRRRVGVMPDGVCDRIDTLLLEQLEDLG